MMTVTNIHSFRSSNN